MLTFQLISIHSRNPYASHTSPYFVCRPPIDPDGSVGCISCGVGLLTTGPSCG